MMASCDILPMENRCDTCNDQCLSEGLKVVSIDVSIHTNNIHTMVMDELRVSCVIDRCSLMHTHVCTYDRRATCVLYILFVGRQAWSDSSTCHFTIAASSTEIIVSVLHKIILNVHVSSAHLSTCHFMTVATSTEVIARIPLSEKKTSAP